MVSGLNDDFVESACDTAVIVTVLGLGTVFGATYNPDREIVPDRRVPSRYPINFPIYGRIRRTHY